MNRTKSKLLHAFRTTTLLFAAALLLPAAAQAAAVEASRLSLPSGPGSIEGLGRNFTPSLSSGNTSYGVDIAVPPAIGGFGPSLALEYDSGGGVSELGLGWRLGGLPALRRRTEDGLPKFDESDRFELVGLGATSELLEVSPGVFRPEHESGAFVRVRRSDDGATWEARDKAGITYRFGGEGCTESEGESTATYLLCEQLDLHGHRIKYDWATTGGQALLQTVTWNAQTPQSTNVVRLSYELRPDVYERFSAGIRQVLDKRLQRIEVTRGGALVRSYALSYNVVATGQSSTTGDSRSLLARVHVTGSDGVTALPDLSFEYTGIRLASGTGGLTVMSSPPGRSPGEANVSLADLNGDSLPDLLVAQAGQYRSYVNHDGKVWEAASSWATSSSPSVSLGDAGVQLADLDADGVVDLVAKSGTTDFRYFPAFDATRLGAAKSITTVPNFSFEDPNVRLADMDGDRRTDVVITTQVGFAIGYNLNGRDWTEPATVGVVEPKQRLMFDDGHTQLCDVNGDRVQDICYLRSGSLTYYLGRGRGRFEAARGASGVPQYDASAPYRLVDVNGDGWIDLVRVGVSQVDYAIASGAGIFTITGSVTGVPTKATSTAVEFADMNGSGTTDIVWIDVANGPDKAWQYLELFREGRSGLLKTIDNGLGKVTRITYAPAALGAARSRDEGKPWMTRLNVGMPVVSEVRTQSALGDPDNVTRFDYRNGGWDAVERTFAGFGRGIQTDIGDESTPTLVTESTFDLGLEARVLRGQPLTTESRDANGSVFTRSTNAYAARDLERGSDNRVIKYAFRAAERVEHLEGIAPGTGKTTFTQWDQDQFGNVTREWRWGLVDGDDKLVGNDEAIVLRTYANNESDWILGRVASEELLDATGKRIALRRSHYDGPAFDGLPLGQVSRGDLRRLESWIAGDYFADEVRVAHDSDGNVTSSIDGKGSRSELFYDAAREHLVRELRHVDGLTSLQWTAEYDPVLGGITRFTEPNGHLTRVSYDVLGRASKIVKPGDSDTRPSLAFEYVTAAPLSKVTTRVRERSGEDGTLDKVVLVDGFGRTRATFAEGDLSGSWILSGYSRFDARGNAWFAAYATETTTLELPAASAALLGTSSKRDALGRTLSVRHPDGSEARTSYAPLERTVSDENDTDPKSPHFGTPTTHLQDGLGRLTRVIEREAGRELVTAQYSYTAGGSLETIADALGRMRRYGYDGRSRRTRIEDPNAGVWSMTYTDGNDLESRTGPDGSVVSFSYDSFGRVLEEWHSDAAGGERVATEYFYDVPAAEHPEFGNALGQLAWVRDEAGTKYFGYDHRGRNTDSIRRWSDGTEHHEWTDFDAQDRAVRRGFPDGSHVAMTYGARGLLSAIGPFATKFDWAAHGGLQSVQLGNGVADTHGYDQRQRLTSMKATDASGAVLRGFELGLDAASRIVSVTDLRSGVPSSESLTARYEYDDRYRLRKATYSAGETSWELDELSNILAVTSTFDEPHLNVTNGFGSAGAPERMTAHGKEVLEYDAAGRVTRDGERELSWDAKGRLAKVIRGGVTEEYVYSYDDRRAVKTTTQNDGSVEVTRYIAEDVEERNGTLVRYVFLGDQRLARLDEVDAGPRTAPVTGTIAPESNKDGANSGFAGAGGGLASSKDLGQRFVFAAAAAGVSLLLLALLRLIWARMRVGLLFRGATATAFAVVTFAACGAPPTRPLSRLERARTESVEITTVPASAEFYLSDGQQSPLAVATSNGQVRSRAIYHAYGQVRSQSGSHGDPFGYVGNEEDRGSGLSDFGARPYRPELGVFLAVDPLALFEPEKTIGAPSRLLAYVYAGGDPINNADPNGLTPVDKLRGFGKGLVDVVKSAAASVVETAKEEYAKVAEGRLGDYAKTILIDRSGVAILGRGVIQSAENLATLGDDIAKVGSATTDYEMGRLAVKPILTAMSTAAIVMGGVGAGKMLTGRLKSIKAPVGGCPGGKCGGPGVCFVAGTLVATAHGMVPIEELRVGQRVDAANSECDSDTLPQSSQSISLQMPNPLAPLDLLEIELVRPETWLSTAGIAAEGESAWFDLDEIGVAGWATVTAISEAPAAKPGPGCLVLMTVKHVASELMRVELDGGAEALELTPVHRLYVEGKGWTAAEKLVDGDRLKTDTGAAHVTSVERINGGRAVYNIEVAREHNYRVSTARVWAHNQCPAGGGPKPSPKFEVPTNRPQPAPARLPEGHSVRVMPATEQYPDGYWVQTNAHGQPVNPSTGKPPANVTRPQARSQTHVPLPPKSE